MIPLVEEERIDTEGIFETEVLIFFFGAEVFLFAFDFAAVVFIVAPDFYRLGRALGFALNRRT
ncbi:hypothetical protein DLM76_06480 [Leptospira yasudae]|uniref:Uncharacterized protein n=1 Tax=Leptospira yasudae TaxID=2202201 RepID=A0ABX9M8Y2_9LEPT|nr:hypothetical protein DLM77_01845 [Leptospira yasudae]RHX94974.1 hypothetical protein DLM76_06480 [Leptospira yasudae]